MSGASLRFSEIRLDKLYHVPHFMQWEPFDVHLCGYDHNNFTNWKLAAHPQCKDYNWDFTEKTPGQLFEKEKLVYITQVKLLVWVF